MFRPLTSFLAGAALIAGLSATARAGEDGELLIWINGDKGYDGLQAVGDRFTAETGIPVKVEHPDDPTNKFQQAASAGKGPDIFIWAHDRLGEWAAAGLVSPIEPSAEIKDDIFELGWEGFTYNNRLWGYPIALEAIGLVYNRKLVPTPPKTFDEVMALDAKLAGQNAKAILWDYNNTYFTWPILAANGGYVFARDAGAFDTAKTGVNSPGALIGAEVLRGMIDTQVMPKGASYSVMEAGFAKGEVAMMINGPWSWDNARKNKIDFAVAPIPRVKGQAAKPFVGVLGAFLNAASPDRDLSVEFIEQYLLKPDGLRTVNDDVPIGAPASKTFFAELQDDPNIAATMASALDGAPMPNVPEMGRFWSSMAVALENMTSGRQSPRDALDAAAARIVK